ncbi:LysR substrate-binding domain-containing protein [Kiloniella sp.]|uniref:LysR substrate-binding domain-containing protein n=1 Tax=Kiloniella sp. TaxID=1938587 RepID=UPI003B029BED
MNTRDLLHPLSAVRAFEAVARLRSVSAAGLDLGVTQPAISQQVKKLELHLGVKLVERVSNTIRLSPEGEKLALSLHTAFGIMRDGMEAAMSKGQVNLAVLSTFAQRWLIPRLPDLQEKFPDIDLRLITSSKLEDLDRGGVDLIIKPILRNKAPEDAMYLMGDEARIVMSPDLAKRTPVRCLEDLRKHVLIRVESSPRDADWPLWLERVGCLKVEPRGWLSFGSSSHALEAAMSGAGIAIGHRPMIVDAMQSGRLVSPLKEVICDDVSNYIIQPTMIGGGGQVTQLKAWLIDQSNIDFHV